MIAKKGEFYGGMGLMAVFIIVLITIFMPVFDGQNGLNYLDALYNSISKGSAYYIPDMREKAKAYDGSQIRVTLAMADSEQARQTALLFNESGAMVNVQDTGLKVSGDLGRILVNCLDDADRMYYNDEKAMSDKYGYGGKRVLFNWWTAFQSMDRELKKQKKFKEAKTSALVVKKAVECSYNYYEIEPQKIRDKYGIVIFSLVFYVVYTLWYGFAILFMFEGWGLKLEH